MHDAGTRPPARIDGGHGAPDDVGDDAQEIVAKLVEAQ
jgi:hypothetical protein